MKSHEITIKSHEIPWNPMKSHFQSPLIHQFTRGYHVPSIAMLVRQGTASWLPSATWLVDDPVIKLVGLKPQLTIEDP